MANKTTEVFQKRSQDKSRARRLIYQSFFILLTQEKEQLSEWAKSIQSGSSEYTNGTKKSRKHLNPAFKIIKNTRHGREQRARKYLNEALGIFGSEEMIMLQAILVGVLSDIYSYELSGDISRESLATVTSFFTICRELGILSENEVDGEGRVTKLFLKRLYSGTHFSSNGWV